MTSCGVSDHCCHLGARGVCPHLEEHTVQGRRWACGLLVREGSWERVYQTPEYVRDVRPFFDGWKPDLHCGTWPTPGETCATCGQVGDG